VWRARANTSTLHRACQRDIVRRASELLKQTNIVAPKAGYDAPQLCVLREGEGVSGWTPPTRDEWLAGRTCGDSVGVVVLDSNMAKMCPVTGELMMGAREGNIDADSYAARLAAAGETDVDDVWCGAVGCAKLMLPINTTTAQ
jgi:hypothetical protein